MLFTHDIYKDSSVTTLHYLTIKCCHKFGEGYCINVLSMHIQSRSKTRKQSALLLKFVNP